jgi:carbonic anhydrase/SulP family sulfate permease
VIQESIDPGTCKKPEEWQPAEKAAYADDVARRNVLHTMLGIRHNSTTLDRLVREGKLAIVGAFYNIGTGEVSFFQTAESSVEKLPVPMVGVA